MKFIFTKLFLTKFHVYVPRFQLLLFPLKYASHIFVTKTLEWIPLWLCALYSAVVLLPHHSNL